MIEWTGVIPALTTKFRSDDSLDLHALEINLQAQIDAGISGAIIGGSLGEASTLNLEEKESLIRSSVNVSSGQIPILLNIAEGSTKEAVHQAQLAESWGAEGIMLLPPMRYRSDERETLAFFKSVARSTSLPILVYNNPVDYKTEITIGMFADLMECQNIQAVKESTRDVTNVSRLRGRLGDRLKILCGVDTIALEELLMGADGWIAGLVNAFPRETVAIYKLAKAGLINDAMVIYKWFMPLLELDIHPKLVQYIKLAESLTGMGSENVREPRLMLEGEEREKVISIVQAGIASRPLLPDYQSIKI
jgi:dihydrodipicolinate synthase/N-acetylneuraminate lyase